MTNIFDGLTKYAETLETTPKENQFTEALAYILSKDKALLGMFLKKFFNIKISEVSIKTQSSYDFEDRKRRPDMEIRGKDTLIIIENKVGSGINDSQIKKYLEILDNNPSRNSKFLILTKYSESKIIKEVKDNRITEKRWSDVYTLFSRYLSKRKSKFDFLIEDFIKFMEGEKMKPFEEINKDEFSSWKKFNMLMDKFSLVFEDLQNELEKKNYTVVSINKNRDDINLKFRPKKCSKKHWDKAGSGKHLKCSIDLSEDEDGKLAIWCLINFWSRGKYYERKIENSKAKKRIYGYLKRKKFEIEDLQSFSKYDDIDDIIKNKRGEQQKKAIIKYFLAGVNELEKSNFIKLLINNQ